MCKITDLLSSEEWIKEKMYGVGLMGGAMLLLEATRQQQLIAFPLK
ncbi:hypothetical protein QYG89_08515 [Bacillus sp. B190/17]|uniref:Uncharacterized protein n=1 Tax=Bacillus lumedeiriae TaxID=3058829 RepID=A0ABW8I8A2_9BACI